MKLELLKDQLKELGESLIVVGDEATIRVHIHTRDAEGVIASSTAFGEIADIDIRDMDQQHQDFVMLKNPDVFSQTAVVAVASGDGLINVFAELGAAAVVSGGQTMNPSTMDILSIVEQIESSNVIILPNNKNVIPTAELVQSLTQKTVTVIPSKTIPQGIAAMIELVPEMDFKTNSTAMKAGIGNVKTIEITRATRDALVNGIKIAQGQYIGMLDGKLKAANDTAGAAILQLLKNIDSAFLNLATIYFGAQTRAEDAEALANEISTHYPSISAGVVNGGQPDHLYIISVE